jgi:hypothetical protein
MWGDPHIVERPYYQYPDSAQILTAGRRGGKDSGGPPEIGYHPAIGPLRSPVAEKPVPVVGRAETGDRDLGDPQAGGLIGQHCADISMGRSGATWGQPQASHDLRPNFIAFPTNTYSTMHYDFTMRNFRVLAHRLHPPFQHPCRRPPPPSVKQGHGAPAGRKQVDWDTVRHGHVEHDPGGCGGMTIHPRHLEPAFPTPA